MLGIEEIVKKYQIRLAMVGGERKIEVDSSISRLPARGSGASLLALPQNFKEVIIRIDEICKEYAKILRKEKN